MLFSKYTSKIDRDTKDLFINFLKERDLLVLFIIYLHEVSKYTGTLKNCFDNPPEFGKLLIDNAFKWTNTKESHWFWYNLSEEWKTFLKEYERKIMNNIIEGLKNLKDEIEKI